MNHCQYLPNLYAITLSLFLLVPLLDTIAQSYEESIPTDVYDLWDVVTEVKNSTDIYEMLKEDGWINDDVSFKDFDYILVLTQQLSGMYDNVEPELILAMIAQESRFNVNAYFHGAYGLMQLLPIYQQVRMEQFVEEGHLFTTDDFYNPRLNIVTGMDYIDYILGETKGDIAYALMWYNQGPVSASQDYLDDNYISDYAHNIINLAAKLRPYLEEGSVHYGVPCDS